jgi:maltose alpha-D-glucosyltransferase/alpha-amylase
MGDNIELFDRNGVRTPMQWDSSPGAGFSQADLARYYAPVISSPDYSPARVNVADQQADPASLWNVLRRMIEIRKAQPVLGWGDFAWAGQSNLGVAAYWRWRGEKRLLAVQNLTGEKQDLVIEPDPLRASLAWQDLFTQAVLPAKPSGRLELALSPYQYLWLVPAP